MDDSHAARARSQSQELARPPPAAKGSVCAHLRFDLVGCAGVHEHRDQQQTPSTGGDVQRCTAVVVDRVERCVRINQQSADLTTTLSHSEVKRRFAFHTRVERGACIDEQRCDLEVAASRRVVQGRASILHHTQEDK